MIKELSEREAIEWVFLAGKGGSVLSRDKEEIYMSEAEKIVKNYIDTLYEGMAERGEPIEVGFGDIKTGEDLAELYQELETSIWRNVRKYYKIIEDKE